MSRRLFSTLRKRGVGSLNREKLFGKNVLVRCDFNVPMSENGVISDDTRIRESIPTLQYLQDQGARIIVASHFGRPKAGEDNRKYSLGVVSKQLSKLLKNKVLQVSESVGPEVENVAKSLKNGQILMLENVRFMAGETKNDPEYARQLVESSNISVYVNDAFGTAHRAHASTAGVVKFVEGPCVAGYLLERELKFLNQAVMNPQRPFAAIIGGSKVSTKIGVLNAIIDSCQQGDAIVIGGGMLFTFLKAKGFHVGASLVEESSLELAKSIESRAKAKGIEFLLPHSLVIADKFSKDANFREGRIESGLVNGEMGVDIGKEDRDALQSQLLRFKTVLWNGPLGVFEWKEGAQGTQAMAEVLSNLTAEKKCTTIVGGGDTVAALELFGLKDRFSHVSTGGGASLELLEGRELPGVSALDPAASE